MDPLAAPARAAPAAAAAAKVVERLRACSAACSSRTHRVKLLQLQHLLMDPRRLLWADWLVEGQEERHLAEEQHLAEQQHLAEEQHLAVVVRLHRRESIAKP